MVSRGAGRGWVVFSLSTAVAPRCRTKRCDGSKSLSRAKNAGVSCSGAGKRTSKAGDFADSRWAAVLRLGGKGPQTTKRLGAWLPDPWSSR